MKKSQKKIGIVLSYAAQAVQMLSGLIYTPIMLKIIGQSEYGLYQLVISVVSYLSLLSLGFGSSYIKFYSKYKAKEEELEIARLNGMFLTIFMVIAGISFVCGIFMIANIRGIFGNGLTEDEYVKAKILMLFMVINLALSFPNSVFCSYVSAKEKFLFQKSLNLLQSILNPLITLPVILLGYGSIGMVLVATILTIVQMIINIRYCFKNIKMKFIFHGFKLSLLKEMWVFTFFIFLNQIIDQLNWTLDKFMLGRLAGTVSIAVYSVGSQINQMYLNFSTSISSVFVPEVNRLVSTTDDNKELTQLFTKVGRIQFFVMALILSGFIFFGKSFIRLWAGEEYGDSYWVAVLLIIPVTVALCQNIGIEIQRAKNKHKIRSIVYLIMALSNIIMSIPLIIKFGPIGAALGTTISLVFGSIIFMNIYYHKKIGLDMIYYWKQIFEIIPAIIPNIVIGIFISNIVNINSWSKLIIISICYSIIYIVIIAFCGLNNYEKQIMNTMIYKLKKKW